MGSVPLTGGKGGGGLTFQLLIFGSAKHAWHCGLYNHCAAV